MHRFGHHSQKEISFAGLFYFYLYNRFCYCSIQYVVITVGGMILQSSINLKGSVFIAGYTAANKLYGFLQCFAMSVGQASCTFVSQNYGAGLGQRVRQGVADSVKIVMGMAVVIIAATLMTKSQLLLVFWM